MQAPPPPPTSSTPTKPCRHCRTPIDPKADRCPFCRSWQRRPFWKNPTVMIVVLGSAAIVALTVISIVFADRLSPFRTMFPKREDFSRYRHRVRIVDASMTSDEFHVLVLGWIQNDSPLGWEHIQLEALFRDARGNVIDTASESFSSLRVPAGQKVAFKLSTIRAATSHDPYHSFEVRIVSADQVRDWP
ncbi:MAG TPA: hypothetical protein VNA25_12340 [Phycisphaerae bacterium]|nr:hypothetical protein [Phycisphaerae bacterium]